MGQSASTVYRVSCHHLADLEEIGLYGTKEKAEKALLQHVLESNPCLITESLIDRCILTDEEFEYLPDVKACYTPSELSLFDLHAHNIGEERNLALRIWNMLKEPHKKLFLDHLCYYCGIPENRPVICYSIVEEQVR